MPTDPIIHCLQQLTDYDAFERLCSSIMSGLDYGDIEPLGGRSDKGRDALFVSRNDGRSFVFAFSVRQDWKTKLIEDCKSIKRFDHSCDELIYVTTSSPTAGQRDKAIEEIQNNYGFALKIYGLERLRIHLAGNLRHLIPQHPQIFTPPYFEFRGGVSTAYGRDLILLDYGISDHAFGLWLTRSLSIQGYSVWCYGLAPMAGDSVDETIRVLIHNRSAKYIPIFSSHSIRDPDFCSRISIATSTKENLLLPAKTGDFDSSFLPSNVRQMEVADFSTSWSHGLRSLLDQLDVQAIPKKVSGERGKDIALQSFIPQPLLKQEPEVIWTNSFSVTQMPTQILIHRSVSVIKNASLREIENQWAFYRVDGRTFASFTSPPISLGFKTTEHYPISEDIEVAGHRIDTIVKQLVASLLRQKGLAVGLKWCEDRKVLYFPSNNGPQRRIPYMTASGKSSTVSVTGVRQWGSGDRAEKFFYQLAPFFRVLVSREFEVSVLLRIYVRVTDNKGVLFEGKSINKRRKKVTKSWWNDHFLARVLGVIQFFSQGEDEIIFGSERSEIRIATKPMTWECPIALDEEAVERLGDFREELASLNSGRYWDQLEELETEEGSE